MMQSKALPITIALHLALFAVLFISWPKSHLQLTSAQKIVNAYVIASTPTPQLAPGKLGLTKLKASKHHHAALISRNHSHWPKLSNQQLKHLLSLLNQEIDQQLTHVNWSPSISSKVLVQFVLTPNNRITQVMIVRSGGNRNIDQKLIQLITELPQLKTSQQHGPLTIALPIRIGHNVPAFNELDNI